MKNNRGEELFVGTKIVVPAPEQDDTWDSTMISQIDDINDDGTIIFSDDQWVEHEIEADRVQIYKK